MADVKSRCQVNDCNRAASTLCFCCRKNVCTRHFIEHIDSVRAQIDPLANETNTLVEKIQGLTVDQLTDKSFSDLRQWQMDMHREIDQIFLAKCQEIESLVANHQDNFANYQKEQLQILTKVQDDVRQLVEDGDATLQQIQSLKNQLVAVETSVAAFQQDFVSVTARVYTQGLVTVSSNANKPLTNEIQQAQELGAKIQAEAVSPILNPEQQRIAPGNSPYLEDALQAPLFPGFADRGEHGVGDHRTTKSETISW